MPACTRSSTLAVIIKTHVMASALSDCPHSISERLAKFLLECSAEGAVTNGLVRTKFTLTHEDISQLIGTTRESITRALAKFRRKDIVKLKGSTLIIHNKPALEQLVAA